MTVPTNDPSPPQPLAAYGGRQLLWHSLLNAAGQGAPVVVALVTVPLLLHGLGTERFGVLTLAWAVVGYFSLFDLGLGRALTRLVAERRGAGADGGAELGAIARTALALMLGLGLAGWAAMHAGASWLVRDALDVSPALQDETVSAFRILAAAIPIVVLTSGLRGLLEAFQRFDLVNAVRVPLGVATYAAPLLVLPFTRSLAVVVTVLLVARAIALVVHAWLAGRVLPALARRGGAAHAPAGALVRTGGWLTVSGVAGPLLVTVDRFLLGALASAAVVAYYTAPLEMVSKLLIVPGAIFSSLFPAMSAADERQGARLFSRGALLVGAAMLPAALAAIALAPELLSVWLGPDFAARGATVLQVLALGVFCNSAAHVPVALLQGRGRAGVVAAVHVLEIPLYVVAAWLLIRARGVEGAAIAWALRAAVDAVVLFAITLRVSLGEPGRAVRRATGLLTLGALLALGAVAVGHRALAVRLPVAVVALAAFAAATLWLVGRAEAGRLIGRRTAFQLSSE